MSKTPSQCQEILSFQINNGIWHRGENKAVWKSYRIVQKKEKICLLGHILPYSFPVLVQLLQSSAKTIDVWCVGLAKICSFNSSQQNTHTHKHKRRTGQETGQKFDWEIVLTTNPVFSFVSSNLFFLTVSNKALKWISLFQPFSYAQTSGLRPP